MRPTATVVIPVWNEWTATEACLRSLRPTLGPADQVVVVDNGSTDGTGEQLAAHPWVEVVTNATNRGFAAACNQGAARARGDVIVFLNNDTVVPPAWLDDLLEPFSDAGVGATGPRSNFVAGPQLVTPVAYDIADHAGFVRWVERWAGEHRGQRDITVVLIGFCLAVRRSAFEEVGGFDEGFGLGGYEDNDLSIRLNDAGWTLLIVHDAFVHHTGHRTFNANSVNWYEVQEGNRPYFEAARLQEGEVLLSAAVIVKNEEANLPACLDALSGLVDEVVVYDTGSTDGTVELAERAGATVVRGYWDDDFGRARNAAMEHCRGRWVLSVDADELVRADPHLVRHILSSTIPFDAMSVKIVNLMGTTAHNRPGLSHLMFRVLRRSRCEWRHRLHEQPCARAGQPELRRGVMQGLELVHSGYLTDIAEPMGKSRRNVRVALQDVAPAGESDEDPSVEALRLINLGRSYTLDKNLESAAECFARARALDSNSMCRRIALRCGTECLIHLGRLEDAEEWLGELRAASGNESSMPAYLAATLELRRNNPVAALAALEGVGEVTTDEGINYGPAMADTARGAALLGQGRWDEAVESFLRAGFTSGEPHWAGLLTAMQAAGGDMAMVAGLVEEHHIAGAAAALVAVAAEPADAFLEALWDRYGAQPAMLAAAAFAAPRVSVTRAAEWSARIRQAGAQALCPVFAILTERSRPPLDRLRAAIVLTSLFDERPADEIIRAIAAILPVTDFGTALQETSTLAPELFPVLIAGAAYSRDRALAMAATLQDNGAGDLAGVVLRAAFGHDDLEAARRSA